MKDIEYRTYVELPPLIRRVVLAGGTRYEISWSEGSFVNELGISVYRTCVVEFFGEPDYSALVEAIIRSRYSASDETAILLNSLNGARAAPEKALEYQAELDALQCFRAHAKQLAADAMRFACEQGWSD